MTPADDPQWPDCTDHPTPSGQAEHHWCDWTRGWLVNGLDAPDITPGMRYCVPVIPTLNLYAEVSIGSDQIITDTYELSLVKSEAFTMNEDFVNIGLWVRGEGRLTMSSVIEDWSMVFTNEVCRVTTHGLNEQRHCDQIARSTDLASPEKKAMRWCLGYHDMCWPCYKKTLNVQPAQQQRTTVTVSGDPSTFGSSQFGIHAGDFNVSSSRNSRQERTRDALRQRFSNRATGDYLAMAQRNGQAPMPQGDNNWNGGSI